MDIQAWHHLVSFLFLFLFFLMDGFVAQLETYDSFTCLCNANNLDK